MPNRTPSETAEPKLTAGQLAETLGVHEQTVLLWARQRLIPFEVTSPSAARPRRRFLESEVRAAMAARVEAELAAERADDAASA